jgi:hypothetical protein
MIPEHATRLTELDEVYRETTPGARLRGIRRAAPRLRERIGGSGKVSWVRTYDLVTFPYPAKYALNGMALSPLPYVMMTNRMQIVRYQAGGQTRTLLVNPSDYERGGEAPFFKKMSDKVGPFVTNHVLSVRYGLPEIHLANAGIRPDEIDFITFDHLHVQDVRGWIGPGGRFPRAKLLAQKEELETLADPTPLQVPWYVADGLAGVARDRIVALDGDVLLGPGLALVRTPGHTRGNHTIVLHTDDGLWTISENGVAVDAYNPRASRILGVARAARHWEAEVVLNANTRENTLDQYASMILEKSLADPCRRAPEWPQHFPSSELARHWMAPGLAATYSHGAITHGDQVMGRSRSGLSIVPPTARPEPSVRH